MDGKSLRDQNPLVSLAGHCHCNATWSQRYYNGTATGQCLTAWERERKGAVEMPRDAGGER